MNDIQELLAQLYAKEWTKAAIADGIGVKWQTVHRWSLPSESPEARYPTNVAGVRLQLEGLLRRQRIPKKKRYNKKKPSAG